MLTIEQFEEYVADLELHDWQHMFSDDHKVYLKESKKEKDLMAVSNNSPYLQKAFQAFFHSAHTNNPWQERNVNRIATLNKLRKLIAKQTTAQQ